MMRPGPAEELRLEANAFEEHAEQPHLGGGAFDVIVGGVAAVMVEMRQTIRRPTAEGQQFNDDEQGAVESPRQAQVAVDEVVGDGAVGEEAERHHARHGGDPEAKYGEDKVAGKPGEGTEEGKPAAEGADVSQVVA